jgi:hypothetical protein
VYDKENNTEMEINPEKEPEMFLKSMTRAIRGSYFWAGDMEEWASK